MKVAFLGSRGIPARYSGFETFYEQLAVRLAARGHEVTVYNRSHFIPDVRGEWSGVRLVSLPAIRTKHLETITHTLLSSLHALTQGYDIVYYCIVGNSPLVWLPRLSGARTLLNVDGQDWAREKWTGFARWYQRRCERIAGRTADVVISDAHVIRDRYRASYGIETVFAPYGAMIRHEPGTAVLDRWGLKPRGYILYVGRFVPENAIDLLITAFRGVRTDMKLVIIGDAPYADGYRESLMAMADDRVVFTGYAFGREYLQLSSHAFCTVQPSAVDGTRPAILDQLGFGNAVVVRDTPANMEVVGDCGVTFAHSRPEASLRETLQRLADDPSDVERLRGCARQRIERYYNWDWITDFYEDCFRRLRRRESLVDYDEFLTHRTPR